MKQEECGVVEDAYAGIDAAVSGHMTAIAIGDAAGYDKADYKLSTGHCKIRITSNINRKNMDGIACFAVGIS